jgi:hypothetical protein
MYQTGNTVAGKPGSGVHTWIFQGRFFLCEKASVYSSRTKLDFMLPLVLLYYPKVPTMTQEAVSVGTNMR